MSAQFKAGDICIGQNFVKNIYRNGQECSIDDGLKYRAYISAHTGKYAEGNVYHVTWADGTQTAVHPHQLRKKQPPRSAKCIMREAILKAMQPQEVDA